MEDLVEVKNELSQKLIYIAQEGLDKGILSPDVYSKVYRHQTPIELNFIFISLTDNFR